MTGNVKVVEDGAEAPPESRSPHGPNWLWVTVGFVIGLGLAVVFFTAGTDEPVETAESVPTPELDQPGEPDSETASSTTTQSEPDGISEVITGFPDTLIAVTQLSGSSLGQLTWPLAGPPRVEDLPGFFTADADFDASGRMLAMGAPVPDTGRALLSMGTALRIQPLATDVTGFAWHDTEGGELAYTQVGEFGWQLSTVNSSRDTELVTRAIDRRGEIVGWGDWGFAIQDGDQAILLSRDGEPQQILEGRVLDTGDGGRAVLYDGRLHIVSLGGNRELLDVDLSGIGEPEVAAISPDGSKLAVVGGAGHLIFRLDGTGETTYAPVTSGFPQLAWSSDSRFLISPWIRGVLFVDTERRSAQPLAELTRHTVVAVATVRLGDD